MSRPWLPAALLLISLTVFGCGSPDPVMDGTGVIRAMHARYASVRPQSLVFVQQTVLHRKEDVPADTMTWYEAAQPGLLRIDFAPLDKGNGALFRDGWVYAMRAGSVAKVRREINPLQLLLMDVFQYPPERTVETLDTLGFDLSILREADWDGHPVWVVGAAEGDEVSAQFWVDRERLVILRVIQPVGGGTLTWETRVTGFQDMGGYLQEVSLDMYLDGRLSQEETYLDIQAGLEIDPAVFDTAGWITIDPYWE